MSSLPAAGGTLPRFDETLGALLVGGLLAMALWGLTCVQTFTYFTRRSRDGPLFKLSIAFLWGLDTFDSALNAHFLYHYLVTNYLNPTAIQRPVWSVIIHVANTSIVDFIIRTMFARRFYALSGRNILATAAIMAMSVTDLVVGLTITVRAFSITSFTDLDKVSILFFLNFAAGLASDLSVALGLTTILFLSRTGMRRTNSLIHTLMLYTVNTGLVVAIDAALGMIAYALMPHNFIFLMFYLFLSKLYLNSYLAMLNAREELREMSDEPVSIHLSRLSVPGARGLLAHDPEMPSPSSIEKGHFREMEITVKTEIEKQVDG